MTRNHTKCFIALIILILNLHCLPFCYWILTDILLATLYIFKIKARIVHFRKLGVKVLIKQILLNTVDMLIVDCS